MSKTKQAQFQQTNEIKEQTISKNKYDQADPSQL